VVFDGEQATSVKKRDTGSSAQPVIRERTFDKPGTYKYWCSPHKGNGMLGAVVVG
jgi:plastocyanin